MPEGVSVVIATRQRPELLRRAVRSVVNQTYPGPIEVVVVFDGTEVDVLDDVELPEQRIVRTLANTRVAGLAGARNSGIAASTLGLIAFCDDDDEWKPSKLDLQVPVLEDPEVILVASAIEIHSAGGIHRRFAPNRVVHDDLLHSRITELHPSSFLLRASDLRVELGGIDEEIPASFGEDYDLLLRAASLGTITSVPEPVTIIHWDRTSYFSEKWRGIADGLTFLLNKHPEFARSRRGSARIEGQVAFAYGALGERSAARSWSWRAIRHDPRQPRPYIALVVGMGLVSGDTIVAALNRRGRGM